MLTKSSCTAFANELASRLSGLPAARQARWEPVSQPPAKLVSLGGSKYVWSDTSADFSARSSAKVASSGGAIR